MSRRPPPRAMPAARAFSQCSACGHAAVTRSGASCLLCGAATQGAEAPADLFSGWRCDCYHCTSTPC